MVPRVVWERTRKGPWRDHHVVTPTSRPDPDRALLSRHYDTSPRDPLVAMLTGTAVGLVLGFLAACWWLA